MTDNAESNKDIVARISKLEEKLAFMEHDFEQLDASIREVFEHVETFRRQLTNMHEQVQSNSKLLDESSQTSAANDDAT